MCAAESSERWSERQAENMVLVQCDRDNPLVALGKPRDILDILREGSDRKAYPNWHGICKAAAAEIKRLRAERDEVRQSYCSLMEAYRGGDGRVTANKLGWGYLFPRRPKKEDGK